MKATVSEAWVGDNTDSRWSSSDEHAVWEAVVGNVYKLGCRISLIFLVFELLFLFIIRVAIVEYPFTSLAAEVLLVAVAVDEF